jgi:hypothetical protein
MDTMYGGWLPCMQSMGIPDQMYPMMNMPDQQLESMYPRIYHTVYPAVCRRCDMADANLGPTHIPTKENLENMIENIYAEVEKDVEADIKRESRDFDERQFIGPARPLLRGLIGILLIRELQRRRRRRFFGFPFGGFGFGVPFGGTGFGSPFGASGGGFF